MIETPIVVEPTTPFNYTHFLPLLPLKNVVILPKSIRPIIVGRNASMQAIEYALKHDHTIFVTAQRMFDTENPTEQDIYQYGTRAIVRQVMRLPDKKIKVIVESICRSRLVKTEQYEGFTAVYCEDLPTTSLDKEVEVTAAWRHLQDLYVTYVKLNSRAPADLLHLAKNIHDIDYFSDIIAMHLDINFDERQALLSIVDLNERLLKLIELIKKEIEILNTEYRIRGHVQTQYEKNQREFYLTEQMKAIQKELGRDDTLDELNQIRTKITGMALSQEAKEKVDKELKRLETMPPLSSEAVVSRHYLDWILALPWGKLSEDNIGIAQAESILDQHHAGLIKAKERIIEFLAAKKFSNNTNARSPIICLVGPPGVGKTSLGQSIASSLGREFVRISLGGVRDEAEIRGHRRTYIGALPGKLVQAMRKARTQNPVILLDEIDKMTSDAHGDPASALLEVLDPEQNRAFVDHFLDLEYDLSKVMFIATANMQEGIPFPLLDRMEVINLSGYTDEEKLVIAQKFLIPKALAELHLTSEQFIIHEPELRHIIAEYTKEAGVRQLERVITKLMRKSIQEILLDPVQCITITPERIKDWLGSPKYRKTSLAQQQTAKIGLATGLAWTEFGGDVLEIEATIVPGKGSVTLTGQLGEVMQESAHAALSYIRARAKEFGLTPSFHANKDIHIHIPEGATPKDGPSAGITMCTALISALTRIPVASLAMTGEITLRGRVLGVGGLKEKILAAKRHGFTTIVVPKENVEDIQEVAKEIPSDINLIYAESMDDVIQAVLTKSPFDLPKKPAKKKKKKSKKAKKTVKSK